MSLPSYNYSAIAASYKCLKYYKALYVDKMHREGPESADLKFGSAMHAGVEAILSGGAGTSTFQLLWDQARKENLKYGQLSWDRLLDNAMILLPRFAKMHSSRFTVHTMEQRLKGKLSDISVEGTPDFVGDYKGVPSVVDFKTSGRRYANEKIEVNEQMFLYAELAKQALGYEAKQIVYYVFIKMPEPSIQVLTLDLTSDKVKSMLDNVLEVCKDLDKRTVFPANRNSCVMGQYKCDLFDVCYPKEKGFDYEPSDV